MRWLLMFIFTIGVSANNVILINHTGFKIIRIEIGNRKFEEVDNRAEQILVSVTPVKHDLKLVFKGGAQVDWPAFDFKGVHKITFELIKTKVNAHFE